MGGHYVIASDIGGSGTKTMLFDLSGKVVATAFRESRLHHPEPGATTQDPGEMFASVVEGIRECVQTSKVSAGEIAAIVFDGQQAGMMWVDDEYNAIGPYDSWLDTRCGPMVGVMQERCGARILEKSGTDKNMIQGAKVFWWKEKRPEVFARACKMVMPAAYVGGRLAGLRGAEAYYEDTTLGYNGLADIDKCVWDEEICATLGIPLAKLPRIVRPVEIVGRLKKEYADYFGLPAGIPIVSGAGDFPVAGLGAGICQVGQTGDIAGTASIFFACADRWKPDPSGTIRINKAPLPGRWYLFVLHGGGGCLRWFRDAFCQREKAEMKNVYQYLDAEAAKIPAGADGLVFCPYIGGRLQPSAPQLGGAWLGIQWGHGSGHFYRAMMESIAYEYKLFVEEARKLLKMPPFNETRVFGGGSAGEVWNQIKADVLGLPYVTLANQECSLLGSAILAGYAIGAYKDLAAAAKSVNNTRKRFVPNPDNRVLYDKKTREYAKLLDKHEEMLQGIQ